MSSKCSCSLYEHWYFIVDPPPLPYALPLIQIGISFLYANTHFIYHLWSSSKSLSRNNEMFQRFSTWPNQISRLLLMVLLHGSWFVRSYRSLVLIILGQKIPKTFLSCFLWKLSIYFSSVLVSVHNSELYRNTLSRYLLNKQILIF